MDAECVKVVEIEKGFKALVAKEDLPKGTFLGDFYGKIYSSPTTYTHQIGPNKHLDHKGIVKFGNHSCSPNCRPVYHRRKDAETIEQDQDVEEVSWHLESTRDIAKGEEIRIDYNLTEYSMASPFECRCGANNCLRFVQGFKHLSPEEKRKRLPNVSPVIKQLIEKEL
ncbi:hypothetical protein QZH41_004345 [Actinostola sp. cb2023]|nr:hypothetical protein QZH41_004345 [Actinostola sp. cb2023]